MSATGPNRQGPFTCSLDPINRDAWSCHHSKMPNYPGNPLAKAKLHFAMQLAALEGRVQRLERRTTGPHSISAGQDAGHTQLLAVEGKASSTMSWQPAPSEGRAPARPAGAHISRASSVMNGSVRDVAAQPVSKQQQQGQPVEPLAEDLSTSDLIAQLQGRYREAFAVLLTNREALQNLGRH